MIAETISIAFSLFGKKILTKLRSELLSLLYRQPLLQRHGSIVTLRFVI